MKRILIALVFVVLLFPSLALGETMDDLVITKGLYYKKFTEVPFTGTVTGRGQGKIKNGKKVGPWVRNYYNGKLSSKGNYNNGKRDGLWEVFYSISNNNPFVLHGPIKYRGNYKDGNLET